MNVRLENLGEKGRGRGNGRFGSGNRGRGRGKGRLGTLNVKQQTVNILPKYQIPEINPFAIVPSRNLGRRVQRGGGGGGGGGASSSSSRTKNKPSTTPAETTDTEDAFIIMSITCGRGDARGEVGLAVIDVEYSHMILCQISDCNSYINTLTKINIFHPVEIIMPDTMCSSSNLYNKIREKFENISINGINRIHFVDKDGLERIRTHCAPQYSSVELIVQQKYYALAAAAALMKYIEFIQHIQYIPKSMRIEYQSSHNTTMIDLESAQNLELVTAHGGQLNYCLLGALDRCSTPIGRRLLRASILQPPCNIDLINRRQACIVEMVANPSLYSIIQPIVRRLFGANRLLSLAMNSASSDSVKSAERNLNYILLLKNTIDIIPELETALSSAHSPFFKTVFNDLKDDKFKMMKEEISKVIHENARSVIGYTSANMQRCFAVKAGLNDLLDVARQTYCELIDDMQKNIAQLRDKYNLPLTLGCNIALGYHIQLNMTLKKNFKEEDLPNEFVKIRKQKNLIYLTTESLISLNQNCKEACIELHIMSDILLTMILDNVRDHIASLFRLSDNIAELDLILSLSQISSISDYIKPEFGLELQVINSKHPVMDILGSELPTPNEVKASDNYNFHTITGPNMSGKTIYLKQIVLLQILAQIGCFVPASNAKFRIVDNIFCRLGSRDDIEFDASTFMLEIKEMQYILQSISPNSLIIIDELCKSTTAEEGTSIAWAICEKLSMTSAFTFHATHFLTLLKLANIYPHITNHFMEATIIDGGNTGLYYTYQLKQGVSNVDHYGIKLAKVTGLTEEIFIIVKKLLQDCIENKGEENNYDEQVPRCRYNYNLLVAINEEFNESNVNCKKIVDIMTQLICVDALDCNPTEKNPMDTDFGISDLPLSSGGENNTIKMRNLMRRFSKSPVPSEPENKLAKFSVSRAPALCNRQPLKLLHSLPQESTSKLTISVVDSNVKKKILTPSSKINPLADPDSPLFLPQETDPFLNPSMKMNEIMNRNIISKGDYELIKNSPKSLSQKTDNSKISKKSLYYQFNEIRESRKIQKNDLSQSQLKNESKSSLKNTEIDKTFIPSQYSYMRHILKNIGDNSPASTSKDITKEQQNNIYSSNVVFRKSTVDLQNNLIEQNDIDEGEPGNPEFITDPDKIINDKVEDTSSNFKMSDENNEKSQLNSYKSNKLRSTSDSNNKVDQHLKSTLNFDTTSQHNNSIKSSKTYSQISVDTVIAKKTAREKEMAIFRIIEGDDFDEKQFLKSFDSHISLSSDEEDNEI